MAAGGCFAWPIACARCHRAVFLPGHWAAQVTRGALAGGLAAAGVLTVQFLALRRSRLAPILLIAIVGLDLAAATWPLQSFAARGLAAVSASATRVVLADSSGRGEPPRLYRANNVLQHVSAAALPPELGELWLLQTFHYQYREYLGIATLPGYDAAIPGRRSIASGNRVGPGPIGVALARGALRLCRRRFRGISSAAGSSPCSILCPARGSTVCQAHCRVCSWWTSQVADDAVALRRILDPAVIAAGLPGSRLSQV